MRDGKSSKDKDYSLRDWFKGGGWKQTGGKYDGKPCAKQPGQTTKPYCRDADDRAAMSKDERDKRAAKKRKEDPNPDRKGKAKIVTQEETKKDACYKKVKAGAKVWPSAYASGRLVQCRKKGAANYGNKSEEMDYSSFRKRAQETQNKIRDKVFKKKEAEKKEDKKEEWVVNTAVEYLFNEGLNEDGLQIFIEELGLESFVEFVYDLAEDVDLHEERAAKRYKYKKGETKETRIAAAREKAGLSVKKSTKSALDTAKEKQPEKKPVKSTLAKGVADTLARGALSAWQGHKAAMKKKKEGGSVASQIGAGLGAATGAMLKKGKKHLSDDYQYSDWREDFKAMEYEFIDIIEAEPLVTEASFEIKHTSADVRKAEKQKKIDALAQKGSTKGERRAAARKAGTSLPSFKKEEVDKRRAPAELVARLSARREGEMAQDGPNKPAYDAKQRLLAKAKEKRMEEEVEQIDELKCWKGYKRKKGSVPGAKGSCVKESEVTEAKDETEIGITGQPIPKKKRSPKKQYEFEKKRRENLGRNVGGKTYSADVAPYKTNPRVGYLRNEYEMENELGEAKNTPTKSDLEANIGGGNLQKLSKKASKRIDYDVDGDIDSQDKVEKSKGKYGEELPTPFGKFRTGDSKKVKVKKEEVSNWRDELDEGWQNEGFKQANYVKMKRKEKKHADDAYKQGPDPQELSGKYRSDSRNRSFKMAGIRDAMMRGEDPRKDTRGGAYKKRGNPDQDHRANYSKNPLNNPKRRVKKPGVNQTSNVDEGWKSALAGAGLATAVALHGGGSKTDKKPQPQPQPKSQSSSVERVSTQQKEKSAMDKWRKANPELAKKVDNPKPFKRKKLSPINPEWAKEHPELAKKERSRRAERGSN